MIVKYWNQVSDIWNICSISQITVHAVNLVLEHLGHVVLVFTESAQKTLQGVQWLVPESMERRQPRPQVLRGHRCDEDTHRQQGDADVLGQPELWQERRVVGLQQSAGAD